MHMCQCAWPPPPTPTQLSCRTAQPLLYMVPACSQQSLPGISSLAALATPFAPVSGGKGSNLLLNRLFGVSSITCQECTSGACKLDLCTDLIRWLCILGKREGREKMEGKEGQIGRGRERQETELLWSSYFRTHAHLDRNHTAPWSGPAPCITTSMPPAATERVLKPRVLQGWAFVGANKERTLSWTAISVVRALTLPLHTCSSHPCVCSSCKCCLRLGCMSWLRPGQLMLLQLLSTPLG